MILTQLLGNIGLLNKYNKDANFLSKKRRSFTLLDQPLLHHHFIHFIIISIEMTNSLLALLYPTPRFINPAWTDSLSIVWNDNIQHAIMRRIDSASLYLFNWWRISWSLNTIKILWLECSNEKRKFHCN
jgi:hypothetical protein